MSPARSDAGDAGPEWRLSWASSVVSDHAEGISRNVHRTIKHPLSILLANYVEKHKFDV